MNINVICNQIDESKTYTIKELTDMGIPRHRLYGAVNRSEFPSRRVFGKTYVSGSDFKKYLSVGFKKD